MTITYYGHSCFKIQSKDLILIIDPFDKSIGFNPPRFRVDIVLVSSQKPDHNNVSSIPEGHFLINGPGEYEVKNCLIKGIDSSDKDSKPTTIYKIETEGLRVCHLGDSGEAVLQDNIPETLGEVDILIIPVGGKETLDYKKAIEFLNQIEPRIVIPMHYKISGLKLPLDYLDNFAKEMGVDPKKSLDKLIIKKKDLPQEGTEVVVLKAG